MPTMVVHRETVLALTRERGWTLKELSRVAVVSYSLIRKLSNGDRATFSEPSAYALAKALSVPVSVIATPAAHSDVAAARVVRQRMNRDVASVKVSDEPDA